MGNVLSANVGQAPAKQAALKAGLPNSTICTTINKVCASGMKSVMLAAQSLALSGEEGATEDGFLMIAGGMESMSNCPFYLDSKARAGLVYGHQTIRDGLLQDGLTCSTHSLHMGECAEECADKYGIGRKEQDEFAIQSYEKAAAAWKSQKFSKEIAPVTILSSKRESVLVEEDEEFSKVNFDKFATLRPVFRAENGTITAANASTLNDGASALVLGHEKRLPKGASKPLARIIAIADAECEPKSFTTAPSLAIPIALKRAGLNVDQIDLFEINEAFSVVALANMKILGLDPAKVNVNGGAVSLGHPLGSSGSRIIVSLVHALKSGQIGCAAICNGGGGASAIIIQKM